MEVIVKKKITIDVFEFDCVNKIPENGYEFIEFFKDKLNLVPEEFRDSAKIQLEPLSDFGPSGWISYERLETDEEEQAREKRDSYKFSNAYIQIEGLQFKTNPKKQFKTLDWNDFITAVSMASGIPKGYIDFPKTETRDDNRGILAYVIALYGLDLCELFYPMFWETIFDYFTHG